MHLFLAGLRCQGSTEPEIIHPNVVSPDLLDPSCLIYLLVVLVFLSGTVWIHGYLCVVPLQLCSLPGQQYLSPVRQPRWVCLCAVGCSGSVAVTTLSKGVCHHPGASIEIEPDYFSHSALCKASWMALTSSDWLYLPVEVTYSINIEGIPFLHTWEESLPEAEASCSFSPSFLSPLFSGYWTRYPSVRASGWQCTQLEDGWNPFTCLAVLSGIEIV